MIRTLGIDFGTCYTAVAVRRGPSIQLVPFGERNCMPSCVLREESSGRLLAGLEAERRQITAPHAFQRTPKRFIGHSEMLLGSERVPMADVIRAVLRQALLGARPVLGSAPETVRFTHPATWKPSKIDLLRAVGERALGEVGWEVAAIELLPEPVAAAVDAAASGDIPVGHVVVVFDLGGGTFDACVVRRTTSGFEVVGKPQGRDPCGGEDFDAALREELTNRIRARFPLVERLLDPPPDDTDMLQARSDFFEDIVDGKEWLSDQDFVDVAIPRQIAGTTGVSEQVKRTELERLIRADLTATVDILVATMQSADGVRPEQLHAVILSGGSSRIPLVEQLVRERTGLKALAEPDRKGVVARGAARWESSEPSRPPKPPRRTSTKPGPKPLEATFRSRLAARIDSSWHHLEAQLVVGSDELVARDFPCDLSSNERWFETARKSLRNGTVMGVVTAARVAGAEDGLQTWLLETGDDGTAVKVLHRFALKRSGGGGRALQIVARDEAAPLADHICLEEPRLPLREYEHVPFVVRVPSGMHPWERLSVVPRRRLLPGAGFTVFAESIDAPEGTEQETWTRYVLRRFADPAVELVRTEDTFLGGRPCLRTVVSRRGSGEKGSAAWSCWWTGVVDGRGVAVAIEGASPVKNADKYRDVFRLADG